MTMACRRHGARGPRAKRSLLLLDDTTWKLTNPIPTIPSPEVRHRLGPFFLCLVLERFQCNESSVHADGPDSLAKHRVTHIDRIEIVNAPCIRCRKPPDELIGNPSPSPRWFGRRRIWSPFYAPFRPLFRRLGSLAITSTFGPAAPFARAG